MKRLEVRLRESARSDLDEIYHYILLRSRSYRIAEGYIDRLLSATMTIGDAPEAGRPRDDLMPGLRTWSFERRVVITYKIEAELVIVVRYFAGGRDMAAFYRKGVTGLVSPS